MTEESARFEERYYLWAREELAREVAEGFPRVRQVKGVDAARTLVLLEAMTTEEQRRLTGALLKRAHAKAAARLNEGMTSEEGEWVRAFDARKLLIQAPLEFRPGAGTLNRPELRKALKAALAPIFGKAQAVFGGREEWRYSTPVRPCLVHTFIDTGGSIRQAEYSHEVVQQRVEGELPWRRAISLLGWLGLCGTTTWNLLTPEEGGEAAQAMAEFCAHFLKAVPGLLGIAAQMADCEKV